LYKEFDEIGHSGGKVTFTIKDEEGVRSYQIGYRSSRPVPMVMIAVYALLQGIPVETIHLGGIGEPWNPPPCPGCFPVFIASDSQGKFGHDCPRCGGYWRSGPLPNICPYCAMTAAPHQFLSSAQRRYVRQYCDVLSEALDSEDSETVMIDMDIVADAAGKEGEKPAFYVSERSQQRKFTCRSCDEYNDILGRFGYCSLCGSRNDLGEFEDQSITVIRERINKGNAPEDCVRDAVAVFDSFLSQYAKQLAQRVPMTEQRKTRLLKQRFHNLPEIVDTFKSWFDIDVCAGIKDGEKRFVARMFLRRHVYEHNGGEADQKYLDQSGDANVVLKQHIHETVEDAHALLGSLVKMARNIDSGFHELFPPIPGPINVLKEKKARMQRRTEVE
jgi:hypothetical protein